jgi:hypothetical protein
VQYQYTTYSSSATPRVDAPPGPDLETGHTGIRGAATPPPRAVLSPSDPRLRELRAFLVACHLASVSLETMSTHLSIDMETLSSELLLGIEAWKLAKINDRNLTPTQHLRGVIRRASKGRR